MRFPRFGSLLEAHARWPRSPEIVVLFLVLLVLGAGCLPRALNHDEAQFVASGALLNRAGLLPYLDYPYFHFPNLVFVFAGLFSAGNFLLLTARSFNVACAWLLLLLVFSLLLGAFRSLGEKRWPVAAAITLILALNPLFRFTAGRAWNHDLPMLASVAAFATLLRAVQPDGSRRWMAASGAFLGVAIGTRLTFLPLVVPFVALTVVFRPIGSPRHRGVVIFFAAFAFSLLPTIALFAANPKNFLFYNLVSNGQLNLLFRRSAEPNNISLGEKLLFPLRLILRSPANLLFVIGFGVFAGWFPFREGWRSVLRFPEATAILVIVPFAILGALIPTPSYRQYYYQVVPFLLLGTAFGIARFWTAPALRAKLFRLLTLVLAASLLEVIPDLHQSGVLTRPDRWDVWEVHKTGLEIRSKVGAGPVLTLSPLYPLEGGAGIYKEFCTGPFAWRIAPFAEEKNAARFDLVSADNLDEFLRDKMPPAILTRVEKRALEKPFVDYARSNKYRKVTLANGGVLWLRREGAATNAARR